MGYMCQDHYGNVFYSMEDMCRYWRISPATYRNRIMAGWSVAAALETPIKKHNKFRNYRYGRDWAGCRRKIR